MEKIVRLGRIDKIGDVFCKIKFTEDGRLSISGVEGPLKNGKCRGSCGQIGMDLKTEEFFSFARGWSKEKVEKFLELWRTWHLNDMQAGCEHQRSEKWVDERIPKDELPNSNANIDEKGILAIWVYPIEHPRGLLTKPCPVCGYKYGSAWLKMEVPKEVIDWLFALPDTDKTPAWV